VIILQPSLLMHKINRSEWQRKLIINEITL